MNYLPGLASNHSPPDLCLLSSWDYRGEPLVPGLEISFLTGIPNLFHFAFFDVHCTFEFSQL
jgi:hypothetical protein